MSLRKLIALDLLLLALRIPGVFNVLAKDHVSTAEGVIALVSGAGLILFLLVLLVLLAVGARRLAGSSAARAGRPRR
jgi:hypothetical protein